MPRLIKVMKIQTMLLDQNINRDLREWLVTNLLTFERLVLKHPLFNVNWSAHADSFIKLMSQYTFKFSFLISDNQSKSYQWLPKYLIDEAFSVQRNRMFENYQYFQRLMSQNFGVNTQPQHGRHNMAGVSQMCHGQLILSSFSSQLLERHHSHFKGW